MGIRLANRNAGDIFDGPLKLDGVTKMASQYLNRMFYDYLSNKFSPRAPNDLTIHATDMYTFCARRWALAHKYKMDPRKDVKYGTSFLVNKPLISFEVGVRMEESLRDALALTNRLIGNIECLKCGHTEIRVAGPCPKCNSMQYRYHQITLVREIEVFSFTGSCDAILLTDEGGCIIEAKTIKSVPVSFTEKSTYSIHKEGLIDYSSLVKPLPEHYYQVQLYLYLARHIKEIAGIPLIGDYGIIAYIPKQTNRPVLKAFMIRANSAFRNDIKHITASLLFYLKKGHLPKKVCDNKLSFLAKNYCPAWVQTECFNEVNIRRKRNVARKKKESNTDNGGM